MRTTLLGSIPSLAFLSSAALLGGCALVAGYDFGRYSERTGEGGGSSTSAATGTGGAAATASSTGTGGGAPTTTVLHTGTDPPIALAVDANAVYFTTGHAGMADGTLFRVEKDGSNHSALAGNLPFPDALALDSTLMYAYWVANTAGKGTIRRILTDGGGVPELIFMPMERVGGLAFSSGTIYWTATESGYLFQNSKATGLDFIVSGQSFPGAIVTDNSNLYWVDRGNDGSSDGLVMKSDLAGKGATALANGVNSPGQIAINAASVHWCTLDGGVYAVLKNGMEEGFIYAPPKVPADPCSSLAADEAHVYFAKGSTVYRALVGSSQAMPYVTDLEAPLKIALDPTSLYVAGRDASGKGTVLKVPR